MRTQLVDGLLADLLQVVRFLRVYVEKSFLKYINNDGVPCSDSSETKIYAGKWLIFYLYKLEQYF